MNHYFLKILISERQHQLLKDAGAVRLATSRRTGDRHSKGSTDTARQAYLSFQGAVGRIPVVSEGSKV